MERTEKDEGREGWRGRGEGKDYLMREKNAGRRRRKKREGKGEGKRRKWCRDCEEGEGCESRERRRKKEGKKMCRSD